MAKFLVEAVESASREFVHEIKCKCGHRHRESFTVPDWNARTKAAETLYQMGFGRPGQVKDDSAGLSDALTRPAEELSVSERRLILRAAKERLSKGADHGEEDGAPGVQGGAVEDSG